MKIDEQMLREYYLEHNNDRASDTMTKIYSMKILHRSLLKELPAERFQGILNVIYVGLNPNATSEEIESTLVICGSVNRTLFHLKAGIHLINSQNHFLRELGLCVWDGRYSKKNIFPQQISGM